MPKNDTNYAAPNFPSRLVFANIHALCLKVFPLLRYLLHELLVRVGYVIEGEDSPAELEEKVCAEGDEGPEG